MAQTNLGAKTGKEVINFSHVWIGTNSIILSGMKIDNSAVIFAGSVITKDVPANAIESGAYEKIIKYSKTK